MGTRLKFLIDETKKLIINTGGPEREWSKFNEDTLVPIITDGHNSTPVIARFTNSQNQPLFELKFKDSLHISENALDQGLYIEVIVNGKSVGTPSEITTQSLNGFIKTLKQHGIVPHRHWSKIP